MPKWKPGAKEFTVSVNFHEVRGFQTVIPRPVAEHLGRPERITFTLRKAKVEIRAEAAHRKSSSEAKSR